MLAAGDLWFNKTNKQKQKIIIIYNFTLYYSVMLCHRYIVFHLRTDAIDQSSNRQHGLQCRISILKKSKQHEIDQFNCSIAVSKIDHKRWSVQLCFLMHCVYCLHFFQVIQWLVQHFIIPFDGCDFISVADACQSIDHMSAEERINVVWQELPIARSVLGPVGHVAHQLGRGHYQKWWYY